MNKILLGLLIIIILVGIWIGIISLQISKRKAEESRPLTPQELEVRAKREAEEQAETDRVREQARQEAEKENIERVKKLEEQYAAARAAELAGIEKTIEANAAIFTAAAEEEAKRRAESREKAEAEGRASLAAYNAKLEQERAAAEAKRAAEQAALAAAAESLRKEEESKLLLQSTPIDYITLSISYMRGPIPIDVAEIEVYNLSNELIPIEGTFYTVTLENYKQTHSYESINAIDRNIDTFARVDPGVHMKVQLTPTLISNISKIVIKPKPGESLKGTYIMFLGTPEKEERQRELLNRIHITEDKNTYTFRFNGSGVNTTWLSSRINLPQYLRHLQNKNYLLY